MNRLQRFVISIDNHVMAGMVTKPRIIVHFEVKCVEHRCYGLFTVNTCFSPGTGRKLKMCSPLSRAV